MNFVLGRLIKILFEEEAFWVFTLLIEDILPLDYYTQMIGVQSDVQIFKTLIKDHLPQIDKKFQELRFDPVYFCLNWFVCLFTDKLSENVSKSFLTV